MTDLDSNFIMQENFTASLAFSSKKGSLPTPKLMILYKRVNSTYTVSELRGKLQRHTTRGILEEVIRKVHFLTKRSNIGVVTTEVSLTLTFRLWLEGVSKRDNICDMCGTSVSGH